MKKTPKLDREYLMLWLLHCVLIVASIHDHQYWFTAYFLVFWSWCGYKALEKQSPTVKWGRKR